MSERIRDFEARLVEHCAPTLAGLKLGSLFCLQADPDEVAEWVSACDETLSDRGLRLRLVRASRCGQLIYVYREKHLQKALNEKSIAAFLRNYGYESDNVQICLERLTERLREQDFPHEIGIFLGYPLHDVEGFIRHGGRNYCCQGCWKVYECRQQAEETFARYHKCKRVYRDCHRAGTTLRRLTVAA